MYCPAMHLYQGLLLNLPGPVLWSQGQAQNAVKVET